MLAEIALFARAPRPGRAKTRLIPVLGPEGAAALYRAFLHDVVSTVSGVGAPIVWAASASEGPALERELGMPTRPQPEGDLGARLEAALEGGGVVLGTDAPTLPPGHLRDAIRALEHADVVLGPAADGGYWLIGARAPFSLASVRWSSRHTLRDTLAAARAAGRAVALARPWYDVDTPRDLSLLRTHLGLRPAAAPHTAAALRRLDARTF